MIQLIVILDEWYSQFGVRETGMGKEFILPDSYLLSFKFFFPIYYLLIFFFISLNRVFA